MFLVICSYILANLAYMVWYCLNVIAVNYKFVYEFLDILLQKVEICIFCAIQAYKTIYFIL